MSGLAIYLLGPPCVERDGKPLEFDARKMMALMAYLAVTGESHSREFLVTLLWPETEPRQARSTLRRNLSLLNKSLNVPYLTVNRETIGLNPDANIWLDVAQFRSLLATPQTHDHPQNAVCPDCLAVLAQATDLYRGDFLAGFTIRNSANFDEWQTFQTEYFKRELAAVLEKLVRGHSAHSESEAAIDYAQRWLALDPLHEPAHRYLMQLYAKTGSRSAALRQYQTCRRLLHGELGILPEQETTALYERIRCETESDRQNIPHVDLVESEPEVIFADRPITPSTDLPLVPGPPPPCPYRGLFAFYEADAPYFFGRESFTRRLVEVVQTQAMVAVVGSSGSGKSSVVFAGLLAGLLQKENWTIVKFRPGSQPFRALAHALLNHLEPELSETEQLIETRKLAEALCEGTLLLPDVVDRILENTPGVNRLLLVADQFEELYTLCPDPDVRHIFLDVLLEAIDFEQFRPNATFTFVFTLRADFLEKALAHRPFADAFQDADLILGPMTREELGRAVEKPAEEQGVKFEPGLVERILIDVAEEPGNLPLLEFALTVLWEKQQARMLTHADYEAIGRVEGALTRHADQVYAELTPVDQELMHRIFIQLVRPGQRTEDTRRVTFRSELSDDDWTLVQRLADARLVVTGQDAAGQEIVEVVHEALIRNWGQLRRWMEADRIFRAWQERLRAALRQWQTTSKDEGALLRGVPLTAAENWLADKREALGQPEIAFIKASVSFRERQEAQREHDRIARERLRQRIISGLALGLFIAVALAGLAGWQWRQAERERQIAEEQRQAAREAQAVAARERDQAQVSFSHQLAAQARENFENQLDLALLLSVEALNIADTVDSRGTLLDALAVDPYLITTLYVFRGSDEQPESDTELDVDPYLITTLYGQSLWNTDVAFSPDGRLVALTGTESTTMLWDIITGQAIDPPLADQAVWVRVATFSPDGKILASAGADQTIRLWDVATGQPVGQPLTGHTQRVYDVTFSPNGQILASAGADSTIMLWDVTTGQVTIPPLTGHSGLVWSVAFSPDGQTLASAGDNGDIRLWNVAGGQLIGQLLAEHTLQAYDVTFSPDGRTLASANKDNTIRLWDVATGQAIGNPLAGHTNSVWGVAFSPNGQILASASRDKTVRLWDVATGQALGSPLRGHTDQVSRVVFSPDGQTLASVSQDLTIRLWDITGRQTYQQTLTKDTQPIWGVAFSPNGQLLASTSEDGSITLWDMATRQPLSQTLGGDFGWARSIAFSPDSQILASGHRDFTIRLWDAASHQLLASPLTGHKEWVNFLAFSPDGQTLASVGSDNTVQLWDVTTAQANGSPLTGHTDEVWSVAFGPNGQTLASASKDKTVRLWDVATGRAIGSPLTGHTDWVWSVAFSPDGQTLASASKDTTVRLWDVATGQPLGPPLAGHTEFVNSIVFSPDGQTLASAADDGLTILWDVATRRPLIQFSDGQNTEVWRLAFSPDGHTLASSNNVGVIMLRDVAVKSWRAQACRKANRNLTEAEWGKFLGQQPYQPTCPDIPVAADE
jgi:WD40 repeat protein/DNA-binding SARP family transcriptional activator